MRILAVLFTLRADVQIPLNCALLPDAAFQLKQIYCIAYFVPFQYPNREADYTTDQCSIDFLTCWPAIQVNCAIVNVLSC